MRVIVTGSRNWSIRDTIHRALLGLPIDTVIVHGGAQGADRIANDVALEQRRPVEVHFADWRRHGKQAGPRRNQKMLDAGADLVLAFPLADSVGTWDMVRRAEKAGVEVRIFGPVVPNGDERGVGS